MLHHEDVQQAERYAELARRYGPSDPLTRIAQVLVKVLTSTTVLLLPVELVTTAVGGCLLALTFGVLALVISILFLPFWALLVGSSWLWLKVWPLMPLLLLPGALVALVADVLVTLLPDEHGPKYWKLTLISEWPLTWLIVFEAPRIAAAELAEYRAFIAASSESSE